MEKYVNATKTLPILFLNTQNLFSRLFPYTSLKEK